MRNNKMLLLFAVFGISFLFFGIIGDATAASGISYTQNPVTYALGQTVTSNLASCAGTLSNVSVSPALPDGMTIVSTTGTIYGLPTQIVASTAYTVSGQCAAAPVTGILTLGIGDAPTAYYVDNVNGNDGADGHTPATAWKSLTQVNNAALGPNTSVRFKRGGVWRGQLIMQGGSSAGGLYYDAYGTGPLPVLMGSVSADNPPGWTPNPYMKWAPSGTGGWTNVGGNIWKSNATFAPLSGFPNGQPYNNANDVGNIIYNPTPTTIATGVEGMTGSPSAGTGQLTNNTSVLTSPGMWLFNTNDYHVYVYSTTNPDTAFPNLELAINTNIVELKNTSYAYLQNFAIKYGAGSGVYSSNNASHVTLRDLQISYIGGGNLGGGGIRYGDAIAFFGNADNDLVERVKAWEIYDGGPNNQGDSPNLTVNNITYRNNIVVNAITPFPMFYNGVANNVSNIFVENNTFVGTNSWSVNQRTNGNQQFGLYLPLGGNPAISNIVFENNVFFDFAGCAIVIGSYTQWQGLMTMDYNDWLSSRGPSLTWICGPPYAPTVSAWAPTYPAEQHGIELNPNFVNLSTGDFHPATGSPLINAGTNLFSAGVVLDFNRNPRPATGAFDIGAFQHLSSP
jgi:hypothetical protein